MMLVKCSKCKKNYERFNVGSYGTPYLCPKCSGKKKGRLGVFFLAIILLIMLPTISSFELCLEGFGICNPSIPQMNPNIITSTTTVNGSSSTYNLTYQNKADYQFTNNNFNGSGNITTTGIVSFGNTSTVGTETSLVRIFDRGSTSITDGIMEIFAKNHNPYFIRLFNEQYSKTVPVFSYFAYNTGVFVMGTDGDKPLGLYTQAYNKVKIYINGSGQVGIGTITPTERLDVNGTTSSNSYSSEGRAGINATGTSCSITRISNGIITGATCI